MSPADIELLFQSRSPYQTTDADQDGDEASISDKEKNYRIQKLKEIALDVQNAWLSGSEELDLIAEKLGDGSRDVSWRAPIGDSGLLDFFLSIINVEGLRQSLQIHALRLIGNSCADTDENRARVVQSKQMPSIVKLFSDDALLRFLIPVVYNVCVDYEPAQLDACKAGLSRVLVDIISSPRLSTCRPLLGVICKILALLAAQEPEADLANPATAELLLDLAVSTVYRPDLEEYCGLMTVALAYLTHERFQTHLLANNHCEVLMQCFEDSYSCFDITSADPEDAAQLKQIWTAFVQIFADISASPSFPQIGSPAARRLIRWLEVRSASQPHLQTAACLCLGNLARSDEASTALLIDVYHPISAILTSSTPPSSQLLHAVLSFLKNLAIPLANKPILGRLLLEPASNSIMSKLWPTDTQPQTQFAAISLTRLLVSGCPENVNRLCTPLQSEPSSSASERTNLGLLVSITSRADAEPTKFEGARTVAAVCKALHSPSSSGSEPLASWANDRASFYLAHETEISRCLADLLTQRRFPALRSEVLFVMALMSRSSDGSKVVCRVLDHAEACRGLVEVVTGRGMAEGSDLASSGQGSDEVVATPGAGLDLAQGLGLEPRQASLDPAEAANMAKVDRENGMVLAAQLLRQEGSQLTQSRRAIFEDMLKAGGEMVLSERQK